MAIPDYQSIMLPLLKFLADEKEHSLREAIEYITEIFNLSEVEKKELLPSGQQAIIHNRVGWARTYMKKAGLIESTRMAYTMFERDSFYSICGFCTDFLCRQKSISGASAPFGC